MEGFKFQTTRSHGESFSLFSKSLTHLVNVVQGTWQFISVRLLSQPGAEHLLQDDLESFFWVLLWVSLRYTAHNQPPEKLGDLLSAFDQVYRQSNEGGEHKHSMLSSRRIPKQIVFSAGKDLNDILGEFSDLFNTRYLDKPTPQALKRYNHLVQAVGPKHDSLQDNHVHSYIERTGRLQTSAYVLERLRNATDNRTHWPRNDKAAVQIFQLQPVTSKKRETDTAKLESACHPQPKKFKPYRYLEEDGYVTSTSLKERSSAGDEELEDIDDIDVF